MSEPVATVARPVKCETRCPDCRSSWPGFDRYERCPGCGMTRDDVEAAAAFKFVPRWPMTTEATHEEEEENACTR